MSGVGGKYFILLIKKIGKKKEKSSSSSYSLGLGRSKVVKTDVLPGTLLKWIDDKTKGSSFYLVFLTVHDDVEVDCIPGEAEEIDSVSMDLLQSIPNCSDRLSVYNDKKWLAEGKTITKGDNVYVKMKIDGSEVPGVVRYRGSVPDLKGIFFGVELAGSVGKGTSDGVYHKKRFFKCAEDGAMFCALNKIRKRRESFEQSDLLKAEGNQYRARHKSDRPVTGCNLSIGERVVWMNDSGPEEGTVKWIGSLPDSRTKDITVGVEFDNPVGSGTGKYTEHRLFYARQNHASLIPLMGLIKSDEFFNTNTTGNSNSNPVDMDSGLYTEAATTSHQQYLNSRGSNNHHYDTLYQNSDRFRDEAAIIKKEKMLYNHDQSLESFPSDLGDSSKCLLGPARGHSPEYCDNKYSQNNESSSLYNGRIVNSVNNNHMEMDKYTKDGMNPLYQYKKLEEDESNMTAARSKGKIDSDLGIGSTVTVPIKNNVLYGVICWIGEFDGKQTAGIETDEEISAGSDGVFMGKRYFNCAPKHALFVPLDKCRKDRRFYTSVRNPKKNGFGSLETPDIDGDVSPPSSLITVIFDDICGKNKGIQGHHNSCYLDAMLFSMFYFTTVFDSILYRPKNPKDIEPYDLIQKVIKEGIVNPLRKNHYVRADKVMKLRELLHKHSSVPGMMNEEKDPEEFLVALLANVMKADPFLHLSSGEHTYFYQLFMEKDDHLLLPTTQRLVEMSCLQGNVKLKEIPSCLIIQMPRFGKDYKMYRRIIPSLELDITDILENSPRECTICGKLAETECRECYLGVDSPFVAHCHQCSTRSHLHPSRKTHKVTELVVPEQYLNYITQYAPQNNDNEPEYVVPREKMELFAVICIQTSHYVSFVKCGSGKDAQWVFFDSMADRMGEQSGYNIPQVTPVPDLVNWLSETKFEELATATDDRVFPEHMRRLLSDAYMCMYQSPEVMKFK